MSGYRLFQTCKYLLFGLLLFNLFYYLLEDLDAYQYLAANASLGQIFETFAVTIDYVAWIILLVLFELETGVLSEEKLEGKLKWFFSGTVALCYVVLLYAFWGYIAALLDFNKYEPTPSETVCSLVEEDYAYLDMAARPIPLDEESCANLSRGEVFKHRADKVVSAAPELAASIHLSWVDIANAAAWLLVVLLFEIEVIWKTRHTLTRRRLFAVKTAKTVIYLTLLGAAIDWTINGAFIDSWDAYLWLLAFVLVDLNIFSFENTSTAETAAKGPI